MQSPRFIEICIRKYKNQQHEAAAAAAAAAAAFHFVQGSKLFNEMSQPLRYVVEFHHQNFVELKSILCASTERDRMTQPHLGAKRKSAFHKTISHTSDVSSTS